MKSSVMAAMARGCFPVHTRTVLSRGVVFGRRLSSRPHPAVDRLLRVGQAEKRAAERFYAGQADAAASNKAEGTELILGNLEREKKYHELYSTLVQERRVRPSILLPLWDIAAFVIGSSTTLLGRQAAMACSVAVKEASEELYTSQLRDLLSENLDDSEKLLKVVSESRDVELSDVNPDEHDDVEKDESYDKLVKIVKSGYKTAIWLTKYN